MTDVIISDNTASYDGGGMYLKTSNPTLTNVTISDNTASYDGGGMYLSSSIPATILNSILWNNTPDQFNSEFYLDTVTYSNIQGGIEGEGNINVDPIFTDPENGDYHLQGTSPCIDAGNPDSEYNDTDGSRNNMGAYGGPGGNW